MSFTVHQPLSLLFHHGQFLTHIYKESEKNKTFFFKAEKKSDCRSSVSYRSWWWAVRFPVHTLYFPDKHCWLTPCTEKAANTCWKHFPRIYNTCVAAQTKERTHTTHTSLLFHTKLYLYKVNYALELMKHFLKGESIN